MKMNNLTNVSLAVLLGLGLTACDGDDGVDGVDGVNGKTTFVSRDDVIKSNANIAYASYSDSLISAIALQKSIKTFVATPTQENFNDAKQAWLDAREPYGQTEVYRFREGPIDFVNEATNEEGPEGALNAWPLGEALIDYISTSPAVDGDAHQEGGTPALSSNIIADAANYPTINKATILDLNGHGEDERNVTTGYHAIEFLLWGQDLNADLGSAQSVRDNTAGQRPVTDYNVSGDCTSGATEQADTICKRRGDYLKAAAQILIDDLTPVVEAWEPNVGEHYNKFIAGGDTSLALILEGMGRLSFGELAGERINVALTTDSQEDEHSCFSDNTHRDIYLNAKGVQNSFNATYTRINGEEIKGASIYDLLLTEGFPELANELRGSLEATMSAAAVIDTKAKSGTPFDVLIQEGVEQKNVIAVINALVEQTDDIEQVIESLEITTNDLRQDTEEDINN